MKLYNHYKNKPYKYIGEAKHSETLERSRVFSAEVGRKQKEISATHPDESKYERTKWLRE